MNLNMPNALGAGVRTGCMVIAVVLLAACASSAPRAPVENRGMGESADAASAPVTTTATARPGYHIVKRGETLYSIAVEYGQSYRDLATWNNLSDVNVIEVGQELRVMPPDAQDVAVITTPTIDVRPLDGMSSSSSATPSLGMPAGATGMNAKSDPRGGKVAYSPQAWTALQAGSAAAATMTAPAGSVSSSASAAAPTTAATPSGDDAVDWMWPASGKVLAGFNDTTNKGLDITGTVGQPVVAAGAGTVLYVGSALRGYGNLVIIRHNNMFLSAYAHNKEILVKEGQTVEKGQKVALMGDTDSDRVMLHFEIRRQGKPVDPAKYLPTH